MKKKKIGKGYRNRKVEKKEKKIQSKLMSKISVCKFPNKVLDN